MLNWYHTLYLGTNVRSYETKIRRRLDRNKPDLGHYLITLASNGTDLLDIIATGYVLQPAVRGRLPMIVGIADSKAEAITLIQEMVSDCLTKRGDVDLRQYFTEG